MLGQVTGMHDFMAATLYLISSNLTYKKKRVSYLGDARQY